MDIFASIFYGVVQGLTEFLPISSSGHNVLLSRLFNIKPLTLSFDIFAHLGSLVAILFFFYKNFDNEKDNLLDKSMTLKIIFLSWIPILVIGYFFRDFFDGRARDLEIVSASFVVSGIFISLHLFKQYKLKFTQVILLMAIFQILAAFPGISRSGITIAIGLLLGLDPRKAVIISFLMSIPVILLASSYDLYSILVNSKEIDNLFNITISFLFSFLFSFLGIKLMIVISKNYHFKWFSIYNILIGIIVLFGLLNGFYLS